MPRTRADRQLPSPERIRHAAATANAGHRPSARPPGHRPSGRLILFASLGTLVLCLTAGGVGVYAAIGDNDGPAVQLANHGVDLRPEWQRNGSRAPTEGDAAGAPVPQPVPPVTAEPSPKSERPAPPPTTAPAPPPAPSPTTPPSEPPATTPPPTEPPNPYLDPSDPRFVPEADRVAWLDGQQRVRACMVAAGFDYLDWEWWQGGSPQPEGLDEQTLAAWLFALNGDEGTAGCIAEAGDVPGPPEGVGPPGQEGPPLLGGGAPGNGGSGENTPEGDGSPDVESSANDDGSTELAPGEAPAQADRVSTRPLS